METYHNQQRIANLHRSTCSGPDGKHALTGSDRVQYNTTVSCMNRWLHRGTTEQGTVPTEYVLVLPHKPLHIRNSAASNMCSTIPREEIEGKYKKLKNASNRHCHDLLAMA